MTRSTDEHPVDYILRTGTITDSGCLVPIQVPKRHGYVEVKHRGKNIRAHKLVWEHHHGPIEKGMQVCHLPLICHNRSCCNIDHLALGTNSENMRHRRLDGTDPNTIKTHCPAGHPYSGDNLRTRPKGNRECRECDRIRAHKKYQRKKQELTCPPPTYAS